MKIDEFNHQKQWGIHKKDEEESAGRVETSVMGDL